MYNEVASPLPDKEKKALVVNTGMKLLIRNLEFNEIKHALVPFKAWHMFVICSAA